MSKAWWKSSQPAGTRPTRTHPVIAKTDPDDLDLTRLLDRPRRRINVDRQRSFDDDRLSDPEDDFEPTRLLKHFDLMWLLNHENEWDSQSDDSTFSPVGVTDTPASSARLSFEPHPPIVGGERRQDRHQMELPQRGVVASAALGAHRGGWRWRGEPSGSRQGSSSRRGQSPGYLVAKMMMEDPSHLR